MYWELIPKICCVKVVLQVKFNLENYLLLVISRSQKGLLASIILFFLSILECIYIFILKIRLLVFDLNIVITRNLNCKVISIGNITAGGTGKTPMVRFLADEYKRKGLEVVIVSRGYKSESSQARIVFNGQKIVVSEEDAGDEAQMLSKMLSDIPIVVGKDRYSAGKLALKEFNPDIILLDDGFQHWKLHRDKDIVLIDGTNPFGYNHLLPRGLLRESLEALSRADIIVITKINSINEDRISIICETIKKYNSKATIFKAKYQSKDIKLHNNNGDIRVISSDYLDGKRVLAFSGIGNPSSFHKSLQECGCTVTTYHKYSDHHQYTLEDVKYIASSILEEQVEIVITTEKDAVKLDQEMLELLTEKCGFVELMVSMELQEKDDLVNSSLSI